MQNVITKSALPAQVPLKMEPGDYIQDGLIYCGKCHTRRQRVIHWPGMPKEGQIVNCECKCRVEARDAEREERTRREEAERLERMKKICMRDKTQRESTFAASDGRNEKYLAFCQQYCDHWKEMQEKDSGLLLWGGVGTGKSFAAACIANEIWNRYEDMVMMTNFSRIINEIYAAKDPNAYIRDLVKYKLLIIDDLGVERESSYALEQIYNVVDARYRTKKPLIVTTNLTLAEIQSASDTAHQRIYSRILEMCIPVDFGEGDGRIAMAEKKREAVKKIFRG